MEGVWKIVFFRPISHFRPTSKTIKDGRTMRPLQKVQGHRVAQGQRAEVDVDVTPRTGGPVGRLPSIRWPCVTRSVQWRKSWKVLRLSSLAKDPDLIHMLIIKSLYLSEKLSDFDEIWYTLSSIEPGYSHVTKKWNFGIKDGRDHHLENRFFGHNWSTDCPISAKFCLRKQNGMPTKAT